MSGLLDFFTLEAGEYLERLDGLLARAAGGPPAIDPFLTDARALRGSATMAKQAAIADVAAGLERLAKALGDSTVAWSPAVSGVVVSAVDDLKILVRAARNWTPADDQRAEARREELARLVPVRPRTSSSAVSPGGSLVYLASESADIAAALDAFARAPTLTANLLAMLPRVRALRGMASLKDLPPLAEVVEAIEDAARPVELGTGSLDTDHLALLRAASAVLQHAAQQMRGGGTPNPLSDEAQRFATALDQLGGTAQATDSVVPIASLFYSDGGEHVVSAAPNPPTTPGQRFRMEVVSQAEHLQRLLSDARQAHDNASRVRAGRNLLRALHALRATAESFLESDVARFIEGSFAAAGALDTLALNAIGEVATLLSNPATDAKQLTDRLRALAATKSLDTAIGAGFSPVGRPTPLSVERTDPKLSAVFDTLRGPPAVPSPAPPPRPSRPMAAVRPSAGAATGADLHALLASGIAGLNKLDKEPFSQPAHIEEEMLPITEFLYRGRAALERAIELRNEIRQRGSAPDSAELDELFALLDLATAE